MAGVEALQLGTHPRTVHRLEEELDVLERIREDVVVVEGLLLLRVDGVVHRAHVQGADLGPKLADVGDAFLHRDADRTGGEVDDHVGPRAHLGEDLRERLDSPFGAAFGVAGVDVDDGGAGIGGPLRLLGYLDRRVWDRGALVARRQHAGQGGGDDDGSAHTGMFPCLRQGRSIFLSRACSMALTITRLVSAGSITSSIIAQAAAR